MKVLILSSGLGSIHRGYERFLMELAAHLRANGIQVTCWGSGEAPSVRRIATLRRDELQQLALERFRTDPALASISAAIIHDWALHTEEHLFGAAAAACLDEELRSKEPTVIYVKWQGGLVDAGGRSTALLERLIRAMQEGPVTTIVRTDWVYPAVIQRIMNRGCLFHTVTPWVTKGLRELGVAPESIFELPNGVMGEPFRQARSQRHQLREEFHIPPDALAVLSIGAFDHELKNFPYVFRELAPLAKDQRIHWVVAGARGKETTAWEREARAAFSERFHPLVDVPFDKMPELYGLADLSVCGSLSETFGLVYAETQLSGLPFVMHNYEVTQWMTAGLPAELCGISLVDMRAPGALAKAVAQWRVLLADEKGHAAVSSIMGQFSAAQAQRFSWESLGSRFAEAFRNAVNPETARKRLQSQAKQIAGRTHIHGVKLVEAGKPAEAIPFLAAALHQEETSERWNDWATCQAACEHHAEAEKGYRRAIEIQPLSAEALANLAVLLVNQKRHAEAIPLLERVLAIPGVKQRKLIEDLLAACKAAVGTGEEVRVTSIAARAVPNLPTKGPLRILVVHETLPQTDCGGADVRLMQVLRAIVAQGHGVTFVARLGLKRGLYEPPLRALGMQVYANDGERLRFLGADITSNWSIDQVLEAGQFDLAILCEWFWTGTSIPEHYLATIRRVSPATRIAVLSDDRHGLRELRMADLTKHLTDIERGKDFQTRETEIYRLADIVLAITEEDRAGFLEITPDLPTELLPMVAEKCAAGPGLGKRKHLLFLGSFSNLANRDGLGWFFDRVWPRIHERLPGVEMHLAGSSMPEALRTLNNGVVGLGRVDDLGQVFAKHRVFISPIRYGTGIKTKNVAAMSHGIPVVTTTIGAEGMNLHCGQNAMIADDDASFAEAVVRLSRDDDLWRKLAKAGRAHVLAEFSSEKLAAQVTRFIDRVRSLQPKALDPNYVASYQRVEDFFPEVVTHRPAKDRPSLRLAAYVHFGEQLLGEGKPAEALSQFRHSFHYIRGGVPRLSVFDRLLQGMERCYRELGDSESAELCTRNRPGQSSDTHLPVAEFENRAGIPEAETAPEAASAGGEKAPELSEVRP